MIIYLYKTYKHCYLVTLVLSTLVLFLNPSNLFAQEDGLKNLINQKIEASKRVDSSQRVQKNQEKQVILNNFENSDSVGNKEDSLDLEAELTFTPPQEPNKKIDTTSFIQRALSVKKRRPAKNYKTEESWNKYYAITSSNAYKKKHVLNENFEVFGWHPYWMGSAYKSYNFSLLSTIAYFSYELNPATGGYYSIHDWKTTVLVDSAHQHGTKVLLSVTNFGIKNNSTFLSNPGAQRNFIDILISLLKERNADGVNIDFESLSVNSRNDLTNFIIDLSNRLKSADKKYMITLALPPIDYNRVYEFDQLNKYVDLYIIMGYEFYGINSSVAGPVAPLESGQTWWDYNLNVALDEYLMEGLSQKKILMGLPYYGAEWETESLKFPSKAKRFVNYPMYRNVIKKHGQLPCCEDEPSKSKFYVYRDDNSNYRQLWYEDSLSLSKKYDWVIERQIGGVGIWALGYDNGYGELWKLLAAKFALGTDEAKIANAKKFWSRYSPRRLMGLSLRIMKNPSYLIKNPRPLMGLFGAIFGVGLLSFYFLFKFGHRIKRTFNVAIKGSLALMIIIMIALIFIGMKYIAFDEIIYLILGFIIGAIIIFFLSKRFLSEKDLP